MRRRLWADARHLVWQTWLRLVGDTAALQEVRDGDRPSLPLWQRTLMGRSDHAGDLRSDKFKPGLDPNRFGYSSVCFRAIRPYQIPDAMKTALHPAVNQIKNGTGI